VTRSPKHNFIFIKVFMKNDIGIPVRKYFLRQIYSYNFHICKLNNLKVIHDLYFQCLIQMTSKSDTEGVYAKYGLIRLDRFVS